MKIRKATTNDIPSILQLWASADLPVKPKGRDKITNLEKQFKLPNMWILVAEEEKVILGVVLVTHDGRKGWINRLAVQPKRIREGIGTKLLKEAEKTLLEKGIEVFAALITQDNVASRILFEKENYIYHKEITYYSKRISQDS
jgi:N-acetylglutamate synthase-like GNAT family acetyltransferase